MGGVRDRHNVQSGDRPNVEQPFAEETSHAAQDDLSPSVPVQPLPAVDYNHLRRLATFAYLPRCLMKDSRPLQLARDGFYYCGRRRVRCLACGAEFPLRSHESFPQAQEQHRHLFHECPRAGDGHLSSEAFLRGVLFWMPLGVEIRQHGVSRQHLNINLN